MSFKNLYEKYVKDEKYGTYSKITNLEELIKNLKGKTLLPKLNKVIDTITANMDEIKHSIEEGNIENLDKMVYNLLEEI